MAYVTRFLCAGIAAAVALTPVLAGQDAAPDYPQWRGRHGDGSASAFMAPKVWPETLTRRWRVEVGEGYGTPLAVGDAVYVFTRRDGNEVMSAHDAATGAERWRSAYSAPYTPSDPTTAHGAGPTTGNRGLQAGRA